MSNKKHEILMNINDNPNQNKFYKSTITREIKNLNFVLKNYPPVTKYNWEVEGKKVYLRLLSL